MCASGGVFIAQSRICGGVFSTKIVKDFQRLAVFKNGFILDLWLGSECASSESLAWFLEFFLAHNVLCYMRFNSWNKTCIDLISIPFFIPSFLLIYPFYNQALNLNLGNFKFNFVFFYLLHITSTIFGLIASIYLI